MKGYLLKSFFSSDFDGEGGRESFPVYGPFHRGGIQDQLLHPPSLCFLKYSKYVCFMSELTNGRLCPLCTGQLNWILFPSHSGSEHTGTMVHTSYILVTAKITLFFFLLSRCAACAFQPHVLPRALARDSEKCETEQHCSV